MEFSRQYCKPCCFFGVLMQFISDRKEREARRASRKKLPLVYCFTARFARPADGTGRSCSQLGFACEGVFLEAHFRDLKTHRVDGADWTPASALLLEQDLEPHAVQPHLPIRSEESGSGSCIKTPRSEFRFARASSPSSCGRPTVAFLPLTVLFPRQWKKSVVDCFQFDSMCRELRCHLKKCVFNCWTFDSLRFPIDSLWCQLLSFGYTGQ